MRKRTGLCALRLRLHSAAKLRFMPLISRRLPQGGKNFAQGGRVFAALQHKAGIGVRIGAKNARGPHCARARIALEGLELPLFGGKLGAFDRRVKIGRFARFERPARLAQRDDDLRAPGARDRLPAPYVPGRKGAAAVEPVPDRRQQQRHVGAMRVLQGKAGLRHARFGVKRAGKMPQTVVSRRGFCCYTAFPFWHHVSPAPPSMDDPLFEEIRRQIAELQSAHRDLDDVIARLLEHRPVDMLQVQRLKKRKLALKDQLARLESQLLPDIIA